jgi:biopolymer transport protein ExbD
MAEINTSISSKKRGIAKNKKLSTKVDLTPMVDLGFLLITFFIFTATLHQPQLLSQFLPADKEQNVEPPKAPNSKVLQLVLSNNNSIAYFSGNDATQAQNTNYSAQGLRNILLQKQEIVAQKFGNAKEMIVLVKPTNKSTYKNFVDVIDELKINGVTRYMLTDLNPTEKNIFEN